MAKEYIGFEYFAESLKDERKKITKLRFENCEYHFWYSRGRYCFKCLQGENSVEKFGKCEDMLNSVTIQNKKLKDIWDSDGLEYFYKPIHNWYKSEKSHFYLLGKEYRECSKIYTKDMAKYRLKRVSEGYGGTLINMMYLVHCWSANLFGLCFFLIFLGGFMCIPPIDGITITIGFFKVACTILYFANVVSLGMVGFFTPLLTDEPDKLKSYLKGNVIIDILAFVSIIIACINIAANIQYALAIKTFIVFILSDIISLFVGYRLYKLYYGKKLREAEKIREEYLNKQSSDQ